MIKNILVCLDGSKPGEAILPLVIELANKFGSKVVLLNVIVVPTVLAGFGKTVVEPIRPNGLSEQEEPIDHYMESLAKSLGEMGLDVKCVTVKGTIGESIVTYAKTYEINLIALATYGRSRLSWFFLGSTTELVLRKSGIPVLAISPG